MCSLALLGFSAVSLYAVDKSADAEGHQWWQHAVFYTLYPRSFADSNNDGIGDLNGITSKLAYLQKLGIDAIWITPCYPSPQVDFGYDVSDYENIDPAYGTLQDFDRMQREARKRGIRVIMDFVINHTSDQHKWFLDSRSSRDSAHRDWYVWRDGKNGGPPNNWNAFVGPAWEFDRATDQYYYHSYFPQQPDLNWRNPAVKQAMFDVARWWYRRGVAGFRLDAVSDLFEDPQMRDNMLIGGVNKYGDPLEKRVYDAAPENHALLRDLRRLSDEYRGVLIGETWTKTIGELQAYYGPEHDELQMPMDFMFMMVKTLSPADFRKQIALAETLKGWPVYVLSNHDEHRAYNRYGDGQHNDAIAKLMAALYLTLRGTPILYYGEEIGMENNDPIRKEDVRDPIGKAGWPGDKGRDGERTPMQWTRGRNAGFTNGTPWLPIPPSAATHNVETEAKDSNSILSFYRQLLMLRHRNSALLDGDYLALNEDDSHVLSYLRRYKGETVLVALNMSASSQEMTFSEGTEEVDLRRAKALLTTSMSRQEGASKLFLGPLGVYIGEVSKGSK